MNFLELIQKNKLTSLVLEGNFGLEKENLRVNLDGSLALTSHPAALGNKALHPYITTDFAESQVELVTPTFKTPKAALDFMHALHDLVSLELKDELLWPYSLPPKLPLDESLIQEAQFSDPEITEYREYLTSKYGKKKQLLSGVHFNFSFSDKFLKALYCKSDDSVSFREFSDQIYLKLARYYMKYAWFFIYLFGANNIAHNSYAEGGMRTYQKINEDLALFDGVSYRNGVSGYRNLEYFYVSYNSLYDYIDDLNQAIFQGEIIAAKEYYSQVRLKGYTKSRVLDDLYKNGINYLEIRTLDLNPLTKVGISLESLEFIHLFLVYALLAPNFWLCADEYNLANLNQILAADSKDSGATLLHYSVNKKKSLQAWGLELINEMEAMLAKLGDSNAIATTLALIKKQLINNGLITEIANGVKKEGYSAFFVNKAKTYLSSTQTNYFSFTGFGDLELSTQIILKEAVKAGLQFEFLDRKDNFIRLENLSGVSEVIKQATKTSLDCYSTVLAMENKLVTKNLLTKNRIIVPEGESYIDLNKALDDYSLYQNKAIVIKPNSTNFGLGVTIFKSKFTEREYKQALNAAFSLDKHILIENFIVGREYRFFIIDNQCAAILYREPANIIGDGVNSITQLVALKNQDPLRGNGYVTPLEKIKLTEVEAMFLANQDLNFDSVIEVGKKVYLRENSNISTGGDSIDYTDLTPNSYKRIAINATKTVGARICGVDMIIKNINNPYPENNYAVLELNFNPAIHIHTYPYIGKNRFLAEKILKALKLID